MVLAAMEFSTSEMNLPIAMSSEKQKQSLIKDYNKQLQSMD